MVTNRFTRVQLPATEFDPKLLTSIDQPQRIKSSSVSDPDPDPVGSVSFGRIRIRIRIRKR